MTERRGAAIWLLTGGLGLLGALLCIGGGVAVFLYGGNPVAAPATGTGGGAPPGVDFSPREVVATVERVTPGAPAAYGAECRFSVEGQAHPQLGYWCNAQIQCGGRLLYGGPSAGFFPCVLAPSPARDVAGEDASTSSQDRDAAMRIDTANRSLTIRDDSAGANGEYVVDARVVSVR